MVSKMNCILSQVLHRVVAWLSRVILGEVLELHSCTADLTAGILIISRDPFGSTRCYHYISR